MKQLTLFLLLLLPGLMLAETPTGIKLVNATATTTTIEFKPGTVHFKQVVTSQGQAQIISLDKGTPLMIAGAPDLPKLTSSLIIPDKGEMQFNVVSSEYYDMLNVSVAPSKGNFKRNLNPSDIPYTYGSVYNTDEFFPSAMVSMSTPYILRDYRGQALSVCPFQYNPQTKVLRIFTKIVVAVTVKNAEGGVNEIERTGSPTGDLEFNVIYKRQFINYSAMQGNLRYTPVSGSGSMLIICHDAFSADMQPFVTWKNKKGIQTDLVLKSVAGSSSAAIKSYIANYYNTHPDLKYVLLVGDAAQVPASSKTAGDSDNDYGYISGNDSYPELFVGRFSATTSAHVQTQVNRTLNYERMPQSAGTWYKKGVTIASSEGPGDNNEMDYDHQRLIRTKLLGYTYNDVTENYDGSQGGIDASGNPSASSILNQVNNGVGIITYTGHGSDDSFVSSGFSTTDVHSLTNTEKHPFIWSVACVNGDFVNVGECFAEAWLRQGTPSQPKGALATFMSTINQSWNPPMKGQDAMVDIMIESVSGNIQRTFGGLSMNGCMEMNDAYLNDGYEMTDTWNIFGDPSVMVYTNTPAPMTVTHSAFEAIGTVTVTVNCNVAGALVCLSANGVILGTGISDGTSAVITIPTATAGIIDVTATAYNKMPYSGTISVSGTTSVIEGENELSFNVYPVPATNVLNIAFDVSSPEKVTLALYNNMGQKMIAVANDEVVNGQFNKQVDITSLASGVYFCKLETASGVFTKYIVVQK
ncbi:MAG: C25 family cysteine peptidase [Bacteroidia bacterium]